MTWRGHLRVAGGVDRQPGQVNRLAGQRPPASSRASSSRSSTSTLIRADSDSTRLRACATSARHRAAVAAGQLGVAADGGQRGAQLVAGVRGEPAQPRLAGVPPGQGRLDVPQHPVERGAELADLGPRVGIGHPVRQGDLAAGQRQLGHLGRGGGRPGAAAAATAAPSRCRAARSSSSAAENIASSASSTWCRVLLQRGQRQPGDDYTVPSWPRIARAGGRSPQARAGRRCMAFRSPAARPAPRVSLRVSRQWPAAVAAVRSLLVTGRAERDSAVARCVRTVVRRCRAACCGWSSPSPGRGGGCPRS